MQVHRGALRLLRAGAARPQGPAHQRRPRRPARFLQADVKGMQGGRASCGSWACSEGGWDSPNPRGTTEWFYVFSGAGAVTDPTAPPSLRPRRRRRLTQGMARAMGRARVHPQGVAGVRARGRGRRQSQAGGDARVAARPRCAELWTNRQRVLRRGVRQGGRWSAAPGTYVIPERSSTEVFTSSTASSSSRTVPPTAPAPGGACEATPSSSPRVGTAASTSSGTRGAAVCCEVSRDEARAHGGVAPGAARPTAEALAASSRRRRRPPGGFAPSVRQTVDVRSRSVRPGCQLRPHGWRGRPAGPELRRRRRRAAHEGYPRRRRGDLRPRPVRPGKRGSIPLSAKFCSTWVYTPCTILLHPSHHAIDTREGSFQKLKVRDYRLRHLRRYRAFVTRDG